MLFLLAFLAWRGRPQDFAPEGKRPRVFLRESAGVPDRFEDCLQRKALDKMREHPGFVTRLMNATTSENLDDSLGREGAEIGTGG
jgi:hypothetical protein